jgi:translation initiation factor IF-2
MRVFELAKQIGISTKELMSLLVQMGISARYHTVALSDSDVQAVITKAGTPAAPALKVTAAKKQVPSVAPKPASRPASKAAPLPIPPPVEKKTWVLIKKKPTPIPEEIPEEVLAAPTPQAPIEAITVSEVAVAGTPPPSPPILIEVTPPVLVAPAPPPPPSGASSSETTTTPSKPSATSPVKEGVGRPEKEKKKGKPDAKADRGRGGREKSVQWKTADWSAPESAADPEVGPAVAPVVQDTRKWQDFRPLRTKSSRKGGRRVVSTSSEITKPRRKVVKLHEGMTVKDLSELIGQKASGIIGKLMEMGKMATINHPVGLVEASLIAEFFGVKAEFVAEKSEDDLLQPAVSQDPALRLPRPPVVTIMGHVDHGKTSLLDAIRQTKVTEGEAGGITQHIGAYMVACGDKGDKKVTFLDTPGHEAFTAMRARGAKVTDIVVLVVAADDGVMPQTIEAVNHARAANVPIIVAINKIDKPEANIDRIKSALADLNLLPESWGGTTIYAEVSAKKKIGLPHFLEMILLQAEVMELTADPHKIMVGAIIEAKMDRGRGPVATVLVQEGTLKVGDAFVTGTYYGRVRALVNDEGKKVTEAGPATPVEVIGLDGIPLAGDTFVVVADERIARDVASSRLQRQRTLMLSKQRKVTLEDLHLHLQKGLLKELNIILKADVQGSAEAVRSAMEKLSSPAVKLRVIHTGVGGITESDILLAAASNAIVIGFNVRPEPKGRDLAEKEEVDIRLYTIIYDAIADVKAAMEGLLEPTITERVLGRMDVRQVFTVTRYGTIAGGYVSDGVLTRSSTGVRVIRDSVLVYEGKLASLRRFKDDVREVQTGYECGACIENFNDLKVGDVIEAYIHDKVAATL